MLIVGSELDKVLESTVVLTSLPLLSTGLILPFPSINKIPLILLLAIHFFSSAWIFAGISSFFSAAFTEAVVEPGKALLSAWADRARVKPAMKKNTALLLLVKFNMLMIPFGYVVTSSIAPQRCIAGLHRLA